MQHVMPRHSAARNRGPGLPVGRGRAINADMFDHIGIVVTDLQHAAEFYTRVLAPLGITAIEPYSRPNGEGWVVMSRGAARAPFFVISAGRPSYWSEEHRASISPCHLSFTAPSKEAVNEFHSVGLELGAKDNGAPGVRRAPFYCAFLIDPDGNNIEAGVYLDA
jgi:catechol 2,3-dioxygenase-like lactoylglutathione lyase family enzyme